MLVPFNSLPSNARIWIHQSDESWDESVQAEIATILSDFVREWTAHSSPLYAGFQFFHQQFIVMAVDESKQRASGCAIDAYIATLRQIEYEFDLSLLNRNLIAYGYPPNIETTPLTNLKNLVSEGVIERHTPIFINAITTLRQLKTSWIVPAEESYLSKYFKKVVS